MLKALFHNRLFMGALAFFVLCVGGSLLYQQHVRHQDGEKLAETQDRVEQWNERQNPTTEVKTGDTSQGGHFHADGTWHGEPHAEVDHPVLPPLQEQETPKFVKPVSDSQDVTMKDVVANDLPSREELEAMSNDQLSGLMEASYEEMTLLSPDLSKGMDEWVKVVSNLTRHAKNRAETDAIMADNADTLVPLREKVDAISREYYVHFFTGHRASKVWNARDIIRLSQPSPDRRFRFDPESLTDEFWATYWSDF